MYNPDYKLGLQRTLEAERERNNILKRTIAVMQSEVSDLNADGEGNHHIYKAAVLSIPMTKMYIMHIQIETPCMQCHQVVLVPIMPLFYTLMRGVHKTNCIYCFFFCSGKDTSLRTFFKNNGSH